MALFDNVNTEQGKKDEKTEQVSLDFGFEAEHSEFDGYTTIIGNEQRDVSNAVGYSIADLEIGNIVSGYSEATIFANEDKDIDGSYVRNYQSVRVRAIDGDEYVDLYANIPRRDEQGFITNLNKFQTFYRTGFDLVFSFMRWIDETMVVDENGEEINKINRVNIDNICKKIDSMEYIKIKIIKGADENYNSWIIMDMKEKI